MVGTATSGQPRGADLGPSLPPDPAGGGRFACSSGDPPWSRRPGRTSGVGRRVRSRRATGIGQTGPRGDGGRRDQQPGRRRGAAIAADRAAVVGVRQLRHAFQGVRPEGRAARPVREGRRRRPGPSLHRGRPDRGAPHPVGPGRRLHRSRRSRRGPAAWRSGRSTRTRSRTTTTCSAACATRTRASAARPCATCSTAST